MTAHSKLGQNLTAQSAISQERKDTMDLYDVDLPPFSIHGVTSVLVRPLWNSAAVLKVSAPFRTAQCAQSQSICLNTMTSIISISG